MPKTSRRGAARSTAGKKRKRKQQPRATRPPRPSPARQTVTSQSTPSTPVAPPPPSTTPLYSYISADLKKIGIIAGALIILLIVLSVVL